MGAIIACVIAACFGAALGLLAAATMMCGKQRDLEVAYSRLAGTVRRFLKNSASLEGRENFSASKEELETLQKSLADADRLAGLNDPADS